eukprot:jgi/Orpsp1_1/1185148/evm.model.c7180000092512.1
MRTEDISLYYAIDKERCKIIDIIIDYGDKNNVILNIDDRDENGNCLVLDAINSNNCNIVSSILKYSLKNHIVIKLNEIYFLENFLKSNNLFKNIDILREILEYTQKLNTILELDKRNSNGNNYFLKSIKLNSMNVVKLIVNYANKNKIVFDVNEKNNEGKYPLLVAIQNKNYEMVCFIKEYADKNNKVLKLNGKDPADLSYPLFIAYKKNNREIVTFSYGLCEET